MGLEHKNIHAQEMQQDKIDHANNTLKNFITHESFGGVLLFFCVIIAMIIANTNFGIFYNEFFGMYLDFHIGGTRGIHISILHFINDVLMSFFFLMVGLEMKREVLYGELAGFRAVSFSVFGAIGGLVLPSAIYIFFNLGTPSVNGFGVAMSTDTAFALGVILLLGKRIPNVIKIFLVTLAVADDLGAISVIAIFYTDQINWIYIYIAIVLLAVLITFNYLDIKYLSLYFAVGFLLWICFFLSGVHATVGAVLLAFTIPGKSQISQHSYLGLKEAYNKLYFKTTADFTTFTPSHTEERNRFGAILYGFRDFFVSSYQNIKKFMGSKSDMEREVDMHKEHERVEILDTIARYSKYAQNPLVRIEYILQPLNAYFIVPLFAFANAGVSIDSSLSFSIDGIFWGIILGLVIGKPLGILGFTWLSEKLRLAKRPEGLTNTQIFSVGALAGIGFTMSMFVANLAYSSNMSVDLAKISVLIASGIAAIIGVTSLYFNTKDSSEEDIRIED
ncbi:Na+/H+ antiporter NhaA [Helicobacter bilis]|uniref:Na(+)/H(+) antiporter NhaA n=1 Tax=Helicobacter bilis TaxID=37372 RepID=A0A4U8UAL0_9HELI|nr:Na+/H+ antiporter NhaA [Helicobacter bilis]TLE10747.1 Na+/H+ antiporter NhaA [Helicobacter bilis]